MANARDYRLAYLSKVLESRATGVNAMARTCGKDAEKKAEAYEAAKRLACDMEEAYQRGLDFETTKIVEPLYYIDENGRMVKSYNEEPVTNGEA